MKQFIVLCAVLPLLMVFLLQFALDQQNDVRIGIVNDIVYAAKEEAKQEGCFTKEIQSRMREQIAGRLHVSPQEIRITATETPRYRITETEHLTESRIRRGMIEYEVIVPVGPLMAGRSLFGLKEQDNICWCTVAGSTPSERLRR
ncbi:MAG: hypothetical protein HUJ80_03740 [Firmicutes bacterium]|nr:hypothetical protein [Bacillota bacterium]